MLKGKTKKTATSESLPLALSFVQYVLRVGLRSGDSPMEIGSTQLVTRGFLAGVLPVTAKPRYPVAVLALALPRVGRQPRRCQLVSAFWPCSY